jgi:hypothetical protein
MAESKKETAPEPVPEVEAGPEAPRMLAPAGASSSAAVHDLLGQLEIHDRNEDKAAAEAVLNRLAELGYGL